MRHKILTVDDAKTVRIIIKKAFRNFDCEIIEAANGVEGLAMADKTMPDLILLDITMPVMDGVEMLTRLKSDQRLKNIPVMMLTAEGGRDHVLKIAKLGVRDYIVKPFKEETLLDKVVRIIDLSPASEGPERQRSTKDPADILVVEDKPAIVQQIVEGLKHLPWKIHSAQSQGAALDFCTRTVPHMIVLSLTLPDESAFSLFRTLRANPKTKSTPVFGLVVKTETAVQASAQLLGISHIVTKPIDIAELESRMSKAMNLDISSRYFNIEANILTMSLPENCTPLVLSEVDQYLQPKLSEAVNSGINKVIIDMFPIRYLHMSALKMLVSAMQACRGLGLNYAVVGNPQLAAECKNLEETKFWDFSDSVETAIVQLNRAPATAPAPQLANT